MTATPCWVSKKQIATVVPLDTNHANAFVIDGVEKFCPPFDHRVRCTTFSSSSAKAPVANTSRGRSTPPSEDDARQTHRENYADEPIVAVHQ